MWKCKNCGCERLVGEGSTRGKADFNVFPPRVKGEDYQYVLQEDCEKQIQSWFCMYCLDSAETLDDLAEWGDDENGNI